MILFPVRSNSQGPSRTPSRNSLDAPGSARPVLTSRPASSAALKSPTPNTRPTARASLSGPRPFLSKTTTTPTVNGNGKTYSNAPTDTTNTGPPAKAKPRPSSIAAPPITPRTNKSALLRAAKMAGAKATPAGKTNGAATTTLKAVKV